VIDNSEFIRQGDRLQRVIAPELPIVHGALGGYSVARLCPGCGKGLRVQRQTTIVHRGWAEEIGPWVCRSCGEIVPIATR
jgi:hypothetical protein